LEIFKDYFPAEEIVKYDGKYIGINLKSILYKHPQHIKKLIEDYIKEYDVSILWNNNKDKYDFQKGPLIVLEDVELTESRLETEMIYMLAPVLASTGYTYVAEKEAGQWRVTDLILNWIS
jgi:hypothetical protein